ncbi:hypothetical protein OG252_51970 [Streptomyces sp. NBC_01352]|uniref:hypothetical protein n=1 Tax=Streptomyces sp. NBC_01352 TaxID=2903834 RepID=UPI002E34DF9D|nr:hypothetical protein [Streptomyces sp. NBC_01352]
MNVPIDVGAGLIFLVSTAVGYAVHRHTRATSTTVPPTGDIGVAFTAGSVTLVALAFLFGVSSPPTAPEPTPTPSQSQPLMPPVHSAVPEASPTQDPNERASQTTSPAAAGSGPKSPQAVE